MDSLGGGRGVGFAFFSENGVSWLSLNLFLTLLLHVCLSHNLQTFVFYCVSWGWLGGWGVVGTKSAKRPLSPALAHKLGYRNSTPYYNQYNA